MFINLNGTMLQPDELLAAQLQKIANEDLFESMYVQLGQIRLANFHLERLVYGIKKCGWKVPSFLTQSFLESNINELALRNNLPTTHRARFSVWKDAEQNDLNYLIKVENLSDEVELQRANGILVGIYQPLKKPNSAKSNLKTYSTFDYAKAREESSRLGLDDMIFLNQQDFVCETTMANIFIIKHNQISTPPLCDECIMGTCRRWIMENYPVQEKNISIEDLLGADEVFISNAVRGILNVRQIDGIQFDMVQAPIMAKRFMAL